MLLATSAAATSALPFIQDRSVIEVLGSGTAQASIRFADNGVGSSLDGNPSPAWEALEWNGSTRKDAGVGAAWEIRATVTDFSNPTSGSALNTWLSLSTTREWVNTRSTTGIAQSELLIEIRRAGATNALASATMNVRAEIF